MDSPIWQFQITQLFRFKSAVEVLHRNVERSNLQHRAISIEN